MRYNKKDIILVILTLWLFISVFLLMHKFKVDDDLGTTDEFYEMIDSLKSEIDLVEIQKDSLKLLLVQDSVEIVSLYNQIDDGKATLDAQRRRIAQLRSTREELQNLQVTSSELLELIINYLENHKDEL